MAGIINKIQETLHMGGDKKDEHKVEQHHGDAHHKNTEQHHSGAADHKEGGIVDKIKGKIHGDHSTENKDGKKKKKDKKKKEGHEHDGHSSSSSDSD